MRDLLNYTTDSDQQSPDTARHHMTGEFLPVNKLQQSQNEKPGDQKRLGRHTEQWQRGLEDILSSGNVQTLFGSKPKLTKSN